MIEIYNRDEQLCKKGFESLTLEFLSVYYSVMPHSKLPPGGGGGYAESFGCRVPQYS